MDQIIIGVDTHKSSHIAVAINTQGARLGTMTVNMVSQLDGLTHATIDFVSLR